MIGFIYYTTMIVVFAPDVMGKWWWWALDLILVLGKVYQNEHFYSEIYYLFFLIIPKHGKNNEA